MGRGAAFLHGHRVVQSAGSRCSPQRLPQPLHPDMQWPRSATWAPGQGQRQPQRAAHGPAALHAVREPRWAHPPGRLRSHPYPRAPRQRGRHRRAPRLGVPPGPRADRARSEAHPSQRHLRPGHYPLRAAHPAVPVRGRHSPADPPSPAQGRDHHSAARGQGRHARPRQGALPRPLVEPPPPLPARLRAARGSPRLDGRLLLRHHH